MQYGTSSGGGGGNAYAGSMIAPAQPQHLAHRRIHEQQRQPQIVYASVDDMHGLPPRHASRPFLQQQQQQHSMHSTFGAAGSTAGSSSRLDPSLFQTSILEPKQVQTGTFVNKLTGEVVPIMEQELPPPNTTIGYIPPEQLHRTNPRMVWLNGNVDHNKQQIHKREVYNDDPTADSGRSVFGSQVYTAKIRERQDEMTRRQLFMNRNGENPFKAEPEHKITQVRFRPALPPTQELDTKGWAPNRQSPYGIDGSVARPSVADEGVQLRQEVRQSMNPRTPLRQPVSHVNMPMPQASPAAHTRSTRNESGDPRQGQINAGHLGNQLVGEGFYQGPAQTRVSDHDLRQSIEAQHGRDSHARGQMQADVHSTVGSFSFDTQSLRDTLKPQQPDTTAFSQHVTHIGDEQQQRFMMGSQDDTKSTAIKQAHQVNANNVAMTSDVPVYGVRRSDHGPSETKQVLIKQAHQVNANNVAMTSDVPVYGVRRSDHGPAETKQVLIKQAHQVNANNVAMTSDVPVYGVRRSDHGPAETKQVLIKQAHQTGSFSTSMDAGHGLDVGGAGHIVSDNEYKLYDTMRSQTEGLAQGFHVADGAALMHSSAWSQAGNTVSETQPSAGKDLTQQVQQQHGGVDWQVAHASGVAAGIDAFTMRTPQHKQGQGLHNRSFDAGSFVHAVDTVERQQTQQVPTSKRQYMQEHTGGLDVRVGSQPFSADQAMRELPVTQKQTFNSSVARTQMPQGMGEAQVAQLSASERPLYTTKTFGAQRDQSRQNVDYAITGAFSHSGNAVGHNDLLERTHRQQAGASLDHLQVSSGMDANVSALDSSAVRADPSKQQHYQTTPGGVSSATPNPGTHGVMAHQAGSQLNDMSIKTMNAQQHRHEATAFMGSMDTGDAARRQSHTQVQLPQRVTYVEQAGRPANETSLGFQTGTALGFEGGLRPNQKTSLEYIEAPTSHADATAGGMYTATSRLNAQTALAVPTERETSQNVDDLLMSSSRTRQRFLPGSNTSQAQPALQTYGSYDLRTQRGSEQTHATQRAQAAPLRANINMRMSPRLVGHLPPVRGGGDKERMTPTRFGERSHYYGEQ